MTTNQHGQPLNRYYNAQRITDRKIDELIGITKGVIADGTLMQSEVEFLESWLEGNRDILDQWPANILYARIQDVLEDGILDSDEEKMLIETLIAFHGGVCDPSLEDKSTSLPLCEPPPSIDFSNSIFCFTGKFATGTRAQVEKAVKELGSDTKKAPTKKTHYLVVGSIGSTDWMHSSFGRKIEKAIAFKDQGLPISIVSEEYWVESLQAESA